MYVVVVEHDRQLLTFGANLVTGYFACTTCITLSLILNYLFLAVAPTRYYTAMLRTIFQDHLG